MNMVRTTITLPGDLHEELRLLSVKQKKSLSRLVIEKFKPGFAKKNIESSRTINSATNNEFKKWLEGALKEDAKILDELA